MVTTALSVLAALAMTVVASTARADVPPYSDDSGIPDDTVLVHTDTERVLNAPTVYAIFWQPNAYHYEDTSDVEGDNASDTKYKNLITTFLSNLGGTSAWNVIGEYFQHLARPVSGSDELHIPNVLRYGGSVTYTTNYPQNTEVSDADIQNVVNTVRASEGWADDNAFYPVFIADGVDVCKEADNCYGQDDGDFCAYHSKIDTTAGKFVTYSVQPSLASNMEGCSLGYSDGNGVTHYLSPNDDAVADSVVNTLAHELFEAATDPSTSGSGWRAQSSDDDLDGMEISDVCARIYPDVDDSASQTYHVAGYNYGTYAPLGWYTNTWFNVVLGGHKFAIQGEWLNSTKSCEVVSSTPSSVTVTTTADNESCPQGPGLPGYSLRCALTDTADNTFNVPMTIKFDIEGGCGGHFCVIRPTKALPPLSGVKVVIDATTQPGYTPDNGGGTGTTEDPMIQLDGGGTLPDGIDVVGDRDGVKGLSITNFTEAGIKVQASDVKIESNFLGTGLAPYAAGGNNIGVFVLYGADNTTIGGSTGAGNLINNSTHAGIEVQSGPADAPLTTGTRINGNIIGTNVTGTAAAGNETGILSHSSVAIDHNVVSGNQLDGIDLVDTGQSSVTGNDIGQSRSGTAIGNGAVGVSLTGDNAGSLVGSASDDGAANRITHNDVGVQLPAAIDVGVRHNVIYQNTSAPISVRGVPAAQCTSATVKCPTISSVSTAVVNGVTTTTIVGSAEPGGTVDVYDAGTPDPSGYGGAKKWLGSAEAQSGCAAGEDSCVTGRFTVVTTKTTGPVLTATTTRVETDDHGVDVRATSQFGPNYVQQLAQTITFTSAPGTATYGGTYRPTATSTSGLPVTLQLDPSSTGCTLTAGVVTYTGLGTCVIDADQAGSASYLAAARVQQQIAVQPAALTIPVEGGRIYGGAASFQTGPYQGLVNGDAASVVTGTLTCTTSTTTATAVGSYAGTISACSGLTATNYTITYSTGTFTVGRATLTITASDGAMTYGGTLPTTTASYSGFVNGQTSAVLTTQPTCTPGVTVTTNAGTHVGSSSCSGAAAANYTISYVAGDVTIAKAGLTVTASSVSTTYGTAPAAITAGYAGFKNGEDASDLSTAPSCSTSVTTTSNVGGYTSSCSGGVATNYSFTYVDGTVTVTKAPLSIKASTVTWVYGGAVPDVTATYTGLVNGQTSAVLTTQPECGTTATSSSNVGDYATSCSGATAANYRITYVSGAATVTKAPLVVTASSGSSVYGSPPATITPSYSGFVLDQGAANLTTKPTCQANTLATTPVGTYANTSSCAGAVSSNYSFTYVNGAVTITRAPLTVTASNGTSVYGDPAPVITPTYSGFVNGQGVSALTVPALCVANVSPTTPAGLYPTAASCSGASAANYSFTYVSAAVTVTKATLLVTAHDAARVFGAANPAFSYSITGFRNSDTGAVVTGAPTLSTPATGASHPGAYPIIVGVEAMHAANYTFAPVAGTLTISRAPISIDAKPVSLLKSLLTVTIRFTAVVHNAETGAAAVGIPVTFSVTTVTGYTVGCTAVTSTAGVASCDSHALLALVGAWPPSYSVEVPLSVDYLGGVATGAIKLI